MSIFSKLFKKENIQVNTNEEKIDKLNPDYAIDVILKIFANLGLLDEKAILADLSKDKSFDSSILKRLMIPSYRLPLESLDKYFSSTKLGYGTIKIKSIKIKLENFAKKKALEEKNPEEVIEELIEYAKDDIVFYAKVLEVFNDTVRRLEESSANQLDFIAMLDYWTTYYKEQELGYPINLPVKIDTLALELKQLPYGGYGDSEIEKFKEAAFKMMEEGKLNNEEAHHTLSRIISSLYNPKKDRYLEDVKGLEKKLQMINESFESSDLEKQQKRAKTIKDFNVMNGHEEDIDSYVEQLRKNLSILEYGGYGNSILDDFSNKAKNLISIGIQEQKPEGKVREEIRAIYQKLVDEYQEKLVELKEETRKIDESELDEATKYRQKGALIDSFHDEVGLQIDPNKQIANMLNELKNLEHGGYGDIKIDEFSDIANERMRHATTKAETRDALSDLTEIKESLISEYQKQLNIYYERVNRIKRNTQISQSDKELALGDCEREFKFAVGFRMNFDKYIENRLSELSDLNGSGYGEEAIREFRVEFQNIANSSDDEKEKYTSIKQLYNHLKQNYFYNIKVFSEWKRLQKENNSLDDLDSLEKLMLSLSPKALEKFLLEDDRKKKLAADRHNYEVAFRYLAKEESQGNQSLFNMRMNELINNIHPYDNELIDRTIENLQYSTINNDIISLVDYIDSTIIRQIMYAEANINKESE